MEKLAIVVPCYNEEEVLKIASEALRGVLDDLIRKGKIAEDSFILFVNDGSKDRTWELIEEEHQAHPVQVCGVKLAGNVGHQFALTAGLITAMDLSDVTVSIDADLQDDVAVIEEMIDKFHNGCDIVYGVRKERKTDTFFKRTTKTKSKRALLWRIAILTFFLSAILDNLTTSIVMIMILRKLVTDHKDRMVYASLVIIAANSGGAFSPIGDVTTIMLWNKGLITAAGVIAEIFIPSVVSMVIPALILQTMLKGELVMPEVSAQQNASVSDFTEGQRKAVFWLGVGGLIFVPIFKSITHLPPFVGILLVLGVLWTATEVFYRGLHRGADAEGTQKRVTKLLSRVDMSTILFFLGILMAVSCLAEIGVLTALGQGLNVVFDGNHYLVTGIIGVLSSIVDNVPLVSTW